MITNVLMVLANLMTAITSILSTIYGKMLVVILFLGSYFSSIAGLIHIILALTIIDGLFGVKVSIKTKGKDSILSYKLRQTIYKLFFYFMFIILVFLIETQLAEGSLITPKVVFAIMSGVELWSISANALILLPDMPFLRLFKKYLTAEISKKLSLSNEEVEELLKGKDLEKTKK